MLVLLGTLRRCLYSPVSVNQVAMLQNLVTPQTASPGHANVGPSSQHLEEMSIFASVSGLGSHVTVPSYPTNSLTGHCWCWS
jgi:hypothetical protein